MSRLWFVAKCVPSKEWVAKKELEKQGITVFLPSFFKRFKNRHIRLSLLFRGYLFFSLDDSRNWTRVMRTTGILDVITHLPHDSENRLASAIDADAIESLRLASLSFDESNGKSSPKTYITQGCRVRIINGLLKGEEPESGALVDWSDEKRCDLIMNMFNKKTKIQFFIKDVELVDGES